MDRSTYLEALHRVYRKVNNPTAADIEAITPHLTEDQRKSVLTHLNAGDSVYFAMPPVRVKHGYLVACYSEYEGEKHLILAFASRTRASYSDGHSRGDIFNRMPFQNEAMSYAEKHWGDDLILDTWESVGSVYLQDPTDLIHGDGVFSDGSPRTKVEIFFTVNDDWGKIVNAHQAPESEVWNLSLVEMTTDPVVGMELIGGRCSYHRYICAYCSYGLGLSSCSNCGNTFRDNHIRMGADTPLPAKMVALLESEGHRFGMDPRLARRRELLQWAEWALERERFQGQHRR